MKKIFRGVLKWTGILLGVWVMAGLVLSGWGIYREPLAKAQATEFCAQIKLGQQSDGIEERAIASGADARLIKWTKYTDGTRTMHLNWVGMPPFSRHICAIKADNARIVSAEYIYMD